MRIGKGCQRCRHRHIRCTVRKGAFSCDACDRLGRDCLLDPVFHFRAVRSIYQRSQGAASRFDLAWDSRQAWVKIPKSLTFVHEFSNGFGERNGAYMPQQSQVATEDMIQVSIKQIQSARHDLPSELSVTLPELTSFNNIVAEGHPLDVFETVSTSTMPNNLESLPLETIQPPSQSISPGTRTPSRLSSREAYLLQCYISKIAPWTDVCDQTSHFSTEVPRRALQMPMVLKAILALAARHDAIMSNSDDWEASKYHGECLQLLIAALAKPDTYDDNLLITVVILRIYEELESNQDEKYHLFGSNRLLNTMSKSASSGALAEAISWQFLRQAIYASVVQRQPMQLDLRNYERSRVFHLRDDASYANVIIYLCARIIQLCEGSHAHGMDEEIWRQLGESVEQWHLNKPASWEPLEYQAADATADRPFPEIWMLSSPTVVGLQYYHTCCIFLILSEQRQQIGTGSDWEVARLQRIIENAVTFHLTTVIGLSMSNETVENAYFMACHLLHRFGYCLRHPSAQSGSLRFLAHVEKMLGWRTRWMVVELEKQWSELLRLNKQ